MLANLLRRNLLPVALPLALVRRLALLVRDLDRAIRSGPSDRRLAALPVARSRILLVVLEQSSLTPFAPLVDAPTPGLVEDNAKGAEDDERTTDGAT